MNIDELREAIEMGKASYGVMGEEVSPVLVEAAQNWLKILEADPELVERIADLLFEVRFQDFETQAAAVLAAISTPTPGAE